MKQVVIENPVINSPFTEPDRHFRFTDGGITNETVKGRRDSRITFPRLMGYRYELPTEHLDADFNEDAELVLKH